MQVKILIIKVLVMLVGRVTLRNIAEIEPVELWLKNLKMKLLKKNKFTFAVELWLYSAMLSQGGNDEIDRNKWSCGF